MTWQCRVVHQDWLTEQSLTRIPGLVDNQLTIIACDYSGSPIAVCLTFEESARFSTGKQMVLKSQGVPQRECR